MSDWSPWVLAVALAFVGWMAVDRRVERSRMRLAALVVLALAGSNAALPLIGAGLDSWRTRESVAATEVVESKEPAPAYHGAQMYGDLSPRTGDYQLFDDAPAALLQRNERILRVQTDGVPPGEDPVGYYLLREVRSEMARRRIEW